MKPPVEIKRVEQGERGISDSASTKKLLQTQRVHSLFRSHFIGHLWKPAVNHEDGVHHTRITWPEKDSDGLDILVEAGFEYALGECLKDQYMKRSGPVNEGQSRWFREFGRRHDGMLAINPLDTILEYDKYFGKNIAPERIAYADVIPPGHVLCFSWLKDNYMHLEFNEDGTADAWMKYNTQIDSKKFASKDDIDDDEPEICDSMLVNIPGLAGASVVDNILDGLI
jgi:hypothetical protein